MLYQILSIVLVVCPSLAPVNPPAKLRDAMQDLGYRMGLRYATCEYNSWFPYHVRRLKEDWIECKAEHWPHIWELERFPDEEWVGLELIQNRAFRYELESHQVCRSWHHKRFQIWIDQLDYEWKCLDYLQDATSERMEPAVRRRALSKLRELLGPEAFYNGGPWQTSSRWGEN